MSTRVNITLACTETGDRDYTTTKNKRNIPGRIELKKYSSSLKRVTLHRETKKKYLPVFKS
ncbi:50S ribosomal protein L33 [Sporosarcina sp. ACRSM]|uniref:50S ribosomal protein L33 n=1 Tax=Sporosarcina sp. ACRSM TaxID=2918216 RepID=UPI001EF44C6A|nr:50S ribosomal protein L33 [Sporosarcina sp. ACRSM]